MPRIDDHEDLIVEQRRRQDAPIADGVADDGEVELSVEQIHERLGSGGRIDANVNLWMLRAVFLEQGGQPVVAGVALRRQSKCASLGA